MVGARREQVADVSISHEDSRVILERGPFSKRELTKYLPTPIGFCEGKCVIRDACGMLHIHGLQGMERHSALLSIFSGSHECLEVFFPNLVYDHLSRRMVVFSYNAKEACDWLISECGKANNAPLEIIKETHAPKSMMARFLAWFK